MSPRHLRAVLGTAAALLLAAPAAAEADSFPLVGWWPMNEGSGQTVHDWSGRGNNGTLGASAAVDEHDPSWIPGVFFGSALRFYGDDYVSIPSSPSLQPQNLTVDAWVRSSGTPGLFKYVISKGDDGCSYSSYGMYTGIGGGLAFYVGNKSGFFLSPAASQSIWDGQWHNVGGTFDGNVVRLYVDGVQVGSGTPSPAGTTIDYSTSTSSSNIGGYAGACDQALDLAGDIDGVQIWSRALPIDTIWRTLKTLLTASR